MAKSFFDQNDQYHKIEECDQNQEETQSDNPQVSIRTGSADAAELSPQPVQSFGGEDAGRDFASMGMFKVDTEDQDDCETEIAANFDLKADEQ